MGKTFREYEYVNKGRKKIDLFIMMFFLLLLCIICAPLISRLLVIVAMLIFACSLCVLPDLYCFSLLFGLFPFANIFKLSPGSISLLTICEIMLLVKIAFELIAKNKELKCNGYLFFGLILTTFYIILFSSQIDYLSVIKLLVRIMLVAYFMRANAPHEIRELSIKLTAYCFSFSMLLMMVLSQFAFYKNSVVDYLREVQYSLDSDLVRNTGLLDDPNYCSLAIMVSMTFISVLYYYKKVKFEYWILVTPLYLLGFTTYSKSYFLTASVFLVLLLFLILFPKHKMLALLLSLVILVVALAIYNGKIDIINKVLLRFETSDITTGRDKLNQDYASYIFSNIKVLLFGEGYNVRALPGEISVHNLYIEMLFRLGIIGSLLFVVTIIGCFPKKRFKSKLVNYLPTIFIAIMYIALGGLDSYGLFYYILLAGVSIYQIRDFENTMGPKTYNVLI